MRYVYADILFLVNFCFDFSLLYLAGRLARVPVAGRRLVGGGLFGAAYGVAALYPSLSFLMSLPAKIVSSALMVAIAFPMSVRKVRSFATVFGLFYLASFVAGGAALAWSYLASGVAAFGPGLAAGELSPEGVVPAVLLGGVLLHWAFVAGRERERLRSLYVDCRVVVAGNAAEFQALVDTGNRLRDPLSDAPVVIVEYPAVTRLLPPEFGPVWEKPEQDDPDLSRLAALLGGSAWSARVRLVPFSSLGKTSGMLIGFRPDEVLVGRRGRMVRRTDVVVCVSPRPLSADGGYRALLPPEVLRSETGA